MIDILWQWLEASWRIPVLGLCNGWHMQARCLGAVMHINQTQKMLHHQSDAQRAARRPSQKREQEEAATWAFGAGLGLRSVRLTVSRMSTVKPSAKLFVCAAQGHPLSSCDWLASDNRMRGGARHRLTDTHSLYVRGKTGKMAQTHEKLGLLWLLHLSLSSSSPLLIADQRGSADLIYLDINQRTVLEYPLPW